MGEIPKGMENQISSLRKKLGDPEAQMPGSEAAAQTLIDQLKDEWGKEKQQREIDNLDGINFKLSNQDYSTKDVLYDCRNPKCTNQNRTPNSYCPICKEKVKTGELRFPRKKIDYKQRKCVCGNWFIPTGATQKWCKICQQQKKRKVSMPKSITTKDQRKAVCLRIRDLVNTGMLSKDATEKASQEILGRSVSSGAISIWRKEAGIIAEGRKIYAKKEKEDLVNTVQKYKANGMNTKEAVDKFNEQYYDFAKKINKKKSKLPTDATPNSEKTPVVGLNIDSISDFIDNMDSVSDFQLLRDLFEAKAQEMAEKLLGKK